VEDEKWTRRFSFMKNMVWYSVQAVTAMDIFKIQNVNVNVVQSVGALGSLKRNQNRIRIFPLETNNCDRRFRVETRRF
jgi:hypothetical protein